MSRIGSRLLPFFLLALFLTGCHTVVPNEGDEQVVHEVATRTSPTPVGEIPEQIELADGLSEKEAIALALWNNPQFHSSLKRLGLARGDLIQAGLLTNPDVQIVFPVGSKIFEATAYIPLEALILRPRRVEIADAEYQRLSQELIQIGLDLVRDVQLACAELAFADSRAALAEEAVKVRKNILDLSEKRLKAGDVSELEVINARAAYLQSKGDAANLKMNISIAMNNLRQLLGLSLSRQSFSLYLTDPLAILHDHQALLREALATRPDLRAGAIAIDNAKRQIELAHWNLLQFSGMIDINSPGRKGFEIGPGFRPTLPIFNRNQGLIARAKANLEQLEWAQEARQQQVALDIQNALAQEKQARDNLEILKKEVLPTFKEAVTLAERSFQRGGSSYLLVLQLTTQYLDSRARELELIRDQRRAQAQLERGVGHQLQGPLSTEIPMHPHDHP